MTDYDVIVIGAGIHGAGVAQAVVAAGYSVLVLEQTGVASGTSSHSSKLIHGGLRYLETLQFSLVRECLRERSLLLKLAPELVKLTSFHIPVYRHTTRRPWQLHLGLSFYSLLGGLQKDTRFHLVPKNDWQNLDGLNLKDLQHVYCYQDGQTDDAALTKAVLASALQLGAEYKAPAVFLATRWGPNGCDVEYSCEDKVINTTARVLVNAAGPWVNTVLDKITPAVKKLDIELVQGAHIVVSGKMDNGIYYLEADADRRAVFVIPWNGNTMVGTTETTFTGDPKDVHPLSTEQDYLKSVLLDYFPRFRRNFEMIDSFAGLRVLPKADTAHSKRSRDTQILLNDEKTPRIISVYGGKLTTYRATAKDVMRRLSGVLPEKKPVADTAQLMLS